MKLLYWTDFFLPVIGGIERLSQQVLPRLAARGFEPFVLTTHHDASLPIHDEYEGIPIYRLPFQSGLKSDNPLQVLTVVRQVARFKRELQPDLIHMHLGGPIAFYQVRTQSAWQAPLLVTLHITVHSKLTSPENPLGQVLRQADHVVGVSQAVLDAAMNGISEFEGKLSVIHNGVTAPSEGFSAPSLHKPTLLCIGRLVREKGFDVMVAAMPAILARRPDAYLVIAGDGPERVQLEEQARALGVDHAIQFNGWVDENQRQALMREATMVVMPSRWQEAFSLVVLEAAWMGRAVIATRMGGLPEAVQDGKTGLIIESENSFAIAEAVLSLLAEPERIRAMSRAARNLAQASFGIERYIEDYSALYRQLASERR
ncbi:MAG: glycosyltransferase family 4 protein [Caldilineales bacterium]|nr:glycosyltransferase family 4 protein [Caldilineales bacterium]